MLLRLNISNFLLIEELELDFESGLTVVTGETGSGKSIIIDALQLVFGARANAEIIRSNQNQATFSAEFSLTNANAKHYLVENDLMDLDNPDNILCRRIIDRNGKNKLYINGNVVTISQLRILGDYILDIHTQFASITLLKPEMQRNLLDEYAGITKEVQQLTVTYKHMIDLEDNLQRALSQKEQLEAKQQVLNEQLDELTALNLQSGEWQQLEEEQKELTNASVLLQELDFVQNLLHQQEGSVLANVNKIQLHLVKLADYTTKVNELINLINSVDVELHELAHGLTFIARDIEENPNRLQNLEIRMSQIFDLSRKYRVIPEEIPQLIDDAKEQLAKLEHDTNTLVLEQELVTIKTQYQEMATRITNLRMQYATELSVKMTELLHQLAINGQFQVQLKQLGHYGMYGLEDIEYQVCYNKGMQLQPLAKAASGGELSRTALALYLLLSIHNPPEVIIFDEIDVGIGGKVAAIVGQMLYELSKTKQVICITHQPQTASYASEHLVVSKFDNDGVTQTQVKYIAFDEKIHEIARMLGGLNITEATLLHAKEMVEGAKVNNN